MENLILSVLLNMSQSIHANKVLKKSRYKMLFFFTYFNNLTLFYIYIYKIMENMVMSNLLQRMYGKFQKKSDKKNHFHFTLFNPLEC